MVSGEKKGGGHERTSERTNERTNERTKTQARTRLDFDKLTLDPGLGQREQGKVAVTHILAAKLLAGDGHRAASAVGNHDRPARWTDEALAVHELVDLDLVARVEQENRAVRQVVDYKPIVVANFTGKADERLVIILRTGEVKKGGELVPLELFLGLKDPAVESGVGHAVVEAGAVSGDRRSRWLLFLPLPPSLHSPSHYLRYALSRKSKAFSFLIRSRPADMVSAREGGSLMSGPRLGVAPAWRALQPAASRRLLKDTERRVAGSLVAFFQGGSLKSRFRAGRSRVEVGRSASDRYCSSM